MQRRSTIHQWSRISAKEGENVTVTLTPQERAFLFAVASFASEFPHFLMEFEDNEKDAVDAFLAGTTSKLA